MFSRSSPTIQFLELSQNNHRLNAGGHHNFFVEILTPMVRISEVALWEVVIRTQRQGSHERHECSYDRDPESLATPQPRYFVCKHTKKTAVSADAQCTFPLRIMQNKCLVFKLLRLWYFVTVTPVEEGRSLRTILSPRVLGLLH